MSHILDVITMASIPVVIIPVVAAVVVWLALGEPDFGEETGDAE